MVFGGDSPPIVEVEGVPVLMEGVTGPKESMLSTWTWRKRPASAMQPLGDGGSEDVQSIPEFLPEPMLYEGDRRTSGARAPAGLRRTVSSAR